MSAPVITRVDDTPAVTSLRRKDLLGHRRPGGRRDLARARYRGGDEGDRVAPDQEGAGAARQDRRQPVLRAEHQDADLVRDRGKAAERRHAEHRHRLVERGQGRNARRYRAQPRGDAARHDRAAAFLVRRLPPAVADLPLGDHQRRRRHARAPDAGAARRVHHPRAQEAARGTEGGHRRRPAAQPRAALEHPPADEDGRGRVGVRPADADSRPTSRGSASARPAAWTRPWRTPT